MEDAIIRANGLTKDYGHGRGVFGLDLAVKRGEVFGYVGTNGSGKTTTIRHLMGFYQTRRGQHVDPGNDSWRDSTRIMNHVSYVPGEIAFPSLPTGTAFLKSQVEFLGVTDLTYLNHVVKLLQLDPSASLKRMSKGMKQKTAIAAALMGDKEILVLDEPTTGLDPLMRDTFLKPRARREGEGAHRVHVEPHLRGDRRGMRPRGHDQRRTDHRGARPAGAAPREQEDVPHRLRVARRRRALRGSMGSRRVPWTKPRRPSPSKSRQANWSACCTPCASTTCADCASSTSRWSSTSRTCT